MDHGTTFHWEDPYSKLRCASYLMNTRQLCASQVAARHVQRKLFVVAGKDSPRSFHYVFPVLKKLLAFETLGNAQYANQFDFGGGIVLRF